MSQVLLNEAKEKMTKAEQALQRELGSIRLWSRKCEYFRSYSSRVLWSTNSIKPIGFNHDSRSTSFNGITI